MSVLEFRLAAVACLIICLCGKISANFWRPISFPSDPNDKYYQTFQNVPTPNVTAKKLMTNFLHIRSTFYTDRVRRSSGSQYVEDIVIVMDGSGSVGSCEFIRGKKALQHMMGVANETGGRADSKYAAVTFASSVTVNFEFLPYSDAAKKIIQISYPGGSTNTQAGLVEAKKLFDGPSSGRRVMARKKVLLVTDGRSNVNSHMTLPKAEALKNSGVQIFVVAVGSYITGIDEMVKVASYPPEPFMFRVKSLQEFWEVIKLVIKEVTPGKYAIQGQNDSPS